MIIGLTGLKRSGKDSVADAIAWKKLSFAGPLKEASAILLNRTIEDMEGTGFDRDEVMPEWGFTIRHFLQQAGTEGMRRLFREDFWIQRMRSEIHQYKDVVVSDVRFLNEAAFIHELGGEVWKVVRPGLEPDGHASEAEIALIEADHTIFNNHSLINLQRKVFTRLQRGLESN